MNEKQISLLAAFLAANVEYAVVGGVAVNRHGYVRAINVPRTTKRQCPPPAQYVYTL
jgi:hypothetical protein